MNVRRIEKADFDRVVEVIDHWWGGPIGTFAHPIFFYELGDSALVVENGPEMIGFLLGFVAGGGGRAPTTQDGPHRVRAPRRESTRITAGAASAAGCTTASPRIAGKLTARG